MTSDTDVVNSALKLVAGGRITSLTDGSPSANAANDIYDDLLEDLLRSHLWNFATKRAKLARLSSTPVFGYDYAYNVPADWLRTVSCHPSTDVGSSTFFREETVEVAGASVRAIVTSADTLYMRYIAKVTDPNLWAADFRNAFRTALARDLAVPLASSNTLEERYSKRHIRDLARAKSADAMGSSPEQRPRGSWVNRRNRGLPNAGTVD